MSESLDNLHVFYRFTVPGIVFTAWISLMLPSKFILRALGTQAGTATFVSALVGASLVIGWLAYFSIYPIWKALLSTRFLQGLRLYPKSPIATDLARLVREKGISWNPEHVWSYFLWTSCPTELRQRIKNLADYGHSLYLTACSFTVLPILLFLATVVWGQYSIFGSLVSRITSTNSNVLVIPEAVIVLFAFLLGSFLLTQGRKRITYALELQDMLLREQRTKFQQMLDTLAPSESK